MFVIKSGSPTGGWSKEAHGVIRQDEEEEEELYNLGPNVCVSPIVCPVKAAEGAGLLPLDLSWWDACLLGKENEGEA